MSVAAGLALLARVEEIAEDLGRLRRRFDSNGDAWTGAYLVDRIVGNVETVDCMLQATAAELSRDLLVECGDEQISVEVALAAVESHANRFRRLLGEAER